MLIVFLCLFIVRNDRFFIICYVDRSGDNNEFCEMVFLIVSVDKIVFIFEVYLRDKFSYKYSLLKFVKLNMIFVVDNFKLIIKKE